MVLSVDITGRIGERDINVAFEAPDGVTALVGPSGAGKSTVLRAIAGLWMPKEGRIVLDGKVFLDRAHGIDIPSHQRNIGAVFQNALLFPHMNIERNLRYGLKNGGDFRGVVDLLDIGQLLNRMPRNLSNGEAQRVSIGRALLSKPDLLLLDEPMTGLDDARRAAMLPYLLSLRETLTVPILYVTHRIDEVAQIAQIVVRIEAGHSREAMPVKDYMRLADQAAVAQG